MTHPDQQQDNVLSSPRSLSEYDTTSRRSSGAYEDYDHEEEYLPELYFPEEIDAEEIVRNSTVETYNSDDDDDDDDGSSLTLFHAGYAEYAPYHNPYGAYTAYDPYGTTWNQQSSMEAAAPLPARHPSSRRAPPSRAPTMQKLDSLPEDPNLVTWDKDDPANPHNWPKHRRWTSTVLIAMFAFIAPMASTMVAPALDTIKEEFELQSQVEEFLIMSIFLLAFAIGPFLWGPLSEVCFYSYATRSRTRH